MRRTAEVEAARARRLIAGGGADPLLPHLVAHLDRASRCDVAVSFLLDSGARLLVEHLRDFLARGGRARILVGDYLEVTEPAALRRLRDLDGALDLRVHESRGVGFHLKSYIFLEDAAGAGEGFAFVGSSNLSAPALTSSIEWNVRIAARDDASGFAEIRMAFERLFADYAVTRVDDAWIAAYEARRTRIAVTEAATEIETPLAPPEPRAIQLEALAALARTRTDGFSAGLVVLATGLGKTWLAAFDSAQAQARRILFVAHREEILDQAVDTFRRVHPRARIGRLDATRRQSDADLVFASIQTLGRDAHLARLAPDTFDYVVVDEFHHAAAATYRKAITHFRPKFLLGLTATPDRSDGADLLALCQDNLVFQRAIAEGIAGGQLCAFRYFGVPDTVEYADIPWRNGRFDLDVLDVKLATEARAQNALEQFRALGGTRCIAFCCSQRHATFMADFFRRAGIASAAVHAGSGSAPRATSLQRLQAGELRVIFAVDMFNEGVDVPLVDTVLMLRPTESAIVWTQQLGRGLRVAPGKRDLVVIDYIGNHRVFLTKLGALAAMLGREDPSMPALRDLLAAIATGRIALPPGCAITYDLEAKAILDALLEPARDATLLEAFYRDFADRHGMRPTALEVFHAGFSPRANADGGWLGFVQRMGGLGSDAATFEVMRVALGRLERTARATEAAIVLRALLDSGDPGERVTIAELARRMPRVVARWGGRLAPSLAVFDDAAAAQAGLRERIVPRLLVTLRGPHTPLLTLADDRLGFAQAAIAASLGRLVGELVDWRLAEALGDGRDAVCNVQRHGGGQPLLFLPGGAAGRAFPRGDLDALADGRLVVISVRKIAINRIVAKGERENILPEMLRRWFGDDAGKPGTGFKVWLRRRGDRVTLEPMSPARAAADAATDG
jgi:superfamily II DNA or RNA helicase/HKD family nuclease